MNKQLIVYYKQSIMLVCREIVEAFEASLMAQRAQQATERVVSLRKNENYIVSILEILLNSEAYQSLNLLQLTAELKTITHIARLTQKQISGFYHSFIKIIQKRGNKDNHKILREVAKNLTLKDYQNWFNFLQFQQFLKYDVDGSNDYKRWMISVAIGIPEACKLKSFQSQSQNCIQKYESLIHQIWPRIQMFEMLQIHYIIKFLYKCIQCSSAQYSIKLMKCFLTFVLRIAKYFFYTNDYFFCVQPAQPFKAAKYLLRLLKSCFIRQISHLNKDYFHMQTWSHSNKDVVALFKNILNQISKEDPFNEYFCQSQILLESIQLVNQYFSVIKHKNFDENIEKLLYVDIPRMLFNLRSIVECQGVNLQSIDDSLNNQPFRLKKSLLRLWRSLSRLDLNFKQTQFHKNNKSIIDISGLMHIKFVFQKLSQTETFFSPFLRRKDLNNQKIWNFQSNQEWIIVAFDLFRVFANEITNRGNCLQNIRMSISDILLLYVLPKIFHKNALIQSHAIAVLATYKEQFGDLKISKDIRASLSHILCSSALNAEQRTVKNTLFCCLPSLKNNSQISDLIRAKIEDIIRYYLWRLQDQEEDNYEMANAFSNIIQFYCQAMSNPQKHLDNMVEGINKIYKKQNLHKISLYMECLEKFIQSLKITDKIGNSMLKLLNFSQSLSLNETDEFLEEEILCCIKAYVKKIRVLSQQSICIFVIFCVFLCHHSDQILRKAKQVKVYGKIKDYCRQQKRETSLDESILYILQYFSVHKKFYLASKFMGSKPYQFYFDALQDCIKFYIQKGDDEEEKLYFFNEIIKGLNTMVQYMFGNSQNGELIVGRIWLLSNLQIFQPYKKQLMNFFDAPNQANPNLVICYQQLVKNLAQLWAISTSYFPEAIQQIIETDYNFIFDLVLLVKNSKSKYEDKNFRCTIISGFRQLLYIPKVRKNGLEDLLNILVGIAEQQRKKKMNCINIWGGGQNSEDNDSLDELDLRQNFVEDNIYNEIKQERELYQQIEYLKQIIKVIRHLKKDEISKYYFHLNVISSYVSELMIQYQSQNDAFM